MVYRVRTHKLKNSIGGEYGSISGKFIGKVLKYIAKTWPEVEVMLWSSTFGDFLSQSIVTKQEILER